MRSVFSAPASYMRLGLLVLGLSGLLLLATVALADRSEARSGQSQTVTVAMLPAMGPLGGGAQTGTATLTAVGAQTRVVLSILPSPDPTDVAQPAHIHLGNCTVLGAVAHPLTNVVNGASSTIVNVSLASLTMGGFAINVHKSPTQLGVWVSCGNIPAVSATGLPALGGR